MGAARRMWDAAKHPRGPDGRFIKVGGAGSNEAGRPASVLGPAANGPKGRTARELMSGKPALRPAPKAAAKSSPIPARANSASPPTWEQLGSPQGPSPVGLVIGHEGGTYERLPGEPRRYRALSSDGRVLTEQARTADDARTALRMDAFERNMVSTDANSAWRKTLGHVSGSWSYETGNIEGFASTTPEEFASIREALKRWTGDKANLRDNTRMAEPRLNMAIRSATEHTATVDHDIAALDKAFTISKTTRAITVHRGYSNGTHILPADWRKRDLKGLEWSTRGFTPTTADPDVAEQYAGFAEDGGFVIRLKLPKGSPAIAITDAIGGMDNEGEILLPRGLSFRITKDHGVQGAYGTRALDAEIVQAKPKAKPRAKPRTARAQFDNARLAEVGRQASTASSREAARQALQGLTVAQLRQVAGDNRVHVTSNATKARLIEAITESLAGRRLDSKALSRR